MVDNSCFYPSENQIRCRFGVAHFALVVLVIFHKMD